MTKETCRESGLKHHHVLPLRPRIDINAPDHHQAKHTRTPDVRFGSMSIKSAAIFPPEISICGDSSCEAHDTEGRLEIAGRSLSATG